MPEHRHAKPSAPPPRWLQGGDEECPHCGQRYHLEAERRCAGCDAPACAHCVSGEALCPECATEAGR
jgi:hypothetical protein